jgi:hypothetical protein
MKATKDDHNAIASAPPPSLPASDLVAEEASEYNHLLEEEYPVEQASTKSKPLVADQVIIVSSTAPPKLVITETPKYNIAENIEARYYNGQTWYAGTIKDILYHEAKRCFVYDVLYGDGEREKQVLESNVRAVNAGQTNESSAEPLTTLLKIDGAKSENATEVYKFNVGDIVEGYFDTVDEWYSGIIVHRNKNSTYSINYEDGDKEAEVEEKRIRRKAKAEESSVEMTIITFSLFGSIPIL